MSNGTIIQRQSTAPASSPAPVRASYQGERGAYGEEAVERFWRGRVRAHPVASFDAVLGALISGAVEWAVLPVWNSTIGPVVAARDALDVHVRQVTRAGEVEVPVRHCLLALPGTTLHDVRHVASHPAALAQCARLFDLNPQLSAVEAFDTAGSARQLASFGESPATGERRWYDALTTATSRSLAAIASEQVAATHGLDVLLRGVNDEPTNFTRFVVLRATEAAQ